MSVSDSNKKKVNNIRVISGLLLCIISCMFILLLQFSAEDIYSCAQNEKYSVDMNYVSAEDMTVSDGLYHFTGTNPSATFELDDSYYFVNAKIKFSKPLEHSEKITFDYAGEDGEYTYWEGDSLYINKGQDVFIAPLSSAWDIKTVKVYLEPSLYDYPSIESITLQKTGKASKFSCLIKWLLENGRVFSAAVVAAFFSFCLTTFLFSTKCCENLSEDNKKTNRIVNLCALGVICSAVFVVISDYIIGDILYVFHDCAGDSAGLFYPTAVRRAAYVAEGNFVGGFDYSKGLGASNGVWLLPLEVIKYSFGVENVALLFALVHFFMMSISGFLIYLFVKKLGMNSRAALLSGFAYAFSADFTIRCGWPVYAQLMFLAAVWLLCFEYIKQSNKWYLMPFATVLLLTNVDTFFQLLWMVLLIAYIPFRYYLDGELKEKKKTVILYEAEYVLINIIFNKNLVSKVSDTISSDRFQRTFSKMTGFVNNHINPVLGTINYEIKTAGFSKLFTESGKLISGFLRTIGQNITGITINYTGSENYLMDLALYCGIFTLVMIPFAIYNINGNRKKAYGFAAACIMAYVFIWPVTLLASGFTGFYKISSQWCIIFMIMIATEGFGILMSGKDLKKGSIIVLGITDLFVFAGSVLAIKKGFVLSKKLLMASLVFVCIYSALILLYRFLKKHRSIVASLLVLVFIAEVISLSYPTFNDRLVYSKDYNPYFDDGTVSAVEYLKQEDENFYRIERQTVTQGDNDSFVQNYYGTRYYTGGALNGNSWFDLYRSLNLPYLNNNRLNGMASDVYAMSLVGAKYYLSADALNDKYGYYLKDRVDGISIYESDYVYPAAFVTDSVISESDFSNLSAFEKSRNYMRGVVINDEQLPSDIKTIEVKNYTTDSMGLKKITVKEEDGIYYPEITNDEMLIVRFVMKENGSNPEYHYTTKGGQEEWIYFGYSVGEKVLEICVDDLYSIEFSNVVSKEMESIEFFSADRDEYYSEYISDIEKLTENPVIFTSCYEDFNYLEGTVECKNDGILTTTFADMTFEIDGEIVDTITVNGAFSGCSISEGVHNVKIYYNSQNGYDSKKGFFTWILSYIELVIKYVILIILIPVGKYINSLMSKRKKENE